MYILIREGIQEHDGFYFSSNSVIGVGIGGKCEELTVFWWFEALTRWTDERDRTVLGWW
jgi:hypothetical protein